MFNIFSLNSELFSNTEFAFYHTQICDQKNIKSMLDTPNFASADTVIISTAYAYRKTCGTSDVSAMPELIKVLLSYNKKVIVTSQSILYNNKTNTTLFDTYVLNHKSEEATMDQINSFYYENRNDPENIARINNQLRRLSKRAKVTFLDKTQYMCNEKAKKCYGMTDDGYKVHFDGGHLTIEGAKFFGKRIYETGWLKLN